MAAPPLVSIIFGPPALSPLYYTLMPLTYQTMIYTPVMFAALANGPIGG
ncbi:hypothetical protein Gotur_021957 [Gossypium turneri]